jgi:uncharacterized lipoprotein NlpE involved in copper resistance
MRGNCKTVLERPHRRSAAIVVLAIVILAVGHSNRAQADSEDDEQRSTSPARMLFPDAVKPVMTDIRVYFKLDPRLTRGLHMGDRWVSPAAYLALPQSGSAITVEARAAAVDDRGRVMDRRVEVDWIPADPDKVTVSRAHGNATRITVHAPNESSIDVVAGGVITTLILKASYHGDITRLQISQ